MEQLVVTKKNWIEQVFDITKIKKLFDSCSVDDTTDFETFFDSFKKYAVSWIATRDIHNMLIKSAIDLCSVDNTKWLLVAWRLNTRKYYKIASKNYSLPMSELYSPDTLLLLIEKYTEEWKYDSRIYDEYSIEEILEIWSYIDANRDMMYDYNTSTLYFKRYLLNPNWEVFELPQHMYIIIAMFLALPEKKENRLNFIKQLYEATSTAELSLPTPTLLNARTIFSQLSSCFEINVGDDLRHIFHSVENMAQISKFGWWIWTYLWDVRSKSSSIRWIKWASGWVLPFVKVINDTAIAVNQLWARAWAISVTLDIWHKDVYEWLDMQTETWDIRRKAFDVFPALAIPDLFMNRVEANLDWTLFDPKELQDNVWYKLQDYWWEEFEKRYIECEGNEDLKLKETVSAKELMKKMLKSQVETWMPYVLFRDTANRLNPNKHCGNIYLSNLCTEIAQNTSTGKFIAENESIDGRVRVEYSPWDTVVCNLASINVAKVNTLEDIRRITEIATRTLDNVITLNMYPIKEAEITSNKYRPIWIGFLWVAQYLADKQIAYDTQEAVDEVDRLFDLYSSFIYLNSWNLAWERGTYKVYEWSDFSKWIFLWKTINELYGKHKNDIWNAVEYVNQNYGMRFGYTTAPAPNTSTALVIGTTAWVVPVYKKYFIETNSVAPMVNVAPNLNPENFWFYKEYAKMKMEKVIDVVSTIQKYIDQSISFEWIVDPNHMSPKELYDCYFQWWRQWLKTVYYVRSMSLDVEKCESCSW